MAGRSINDAARSWKLAARRSCLLTHHEFVIGCRHFEGLLPERSCDYSTKLQQSKMADAKQSIANLIVSFDFVNSMSGSMNTALMIPTAAKPIMSL